MTAPEEPQTREELRRQGMSRSGRDLPTQLHVQLGADHPGGFDPLGNWHPVIQHDCNHPRDGGCPMARTGAILFRLASSGCGGKSMRKIAPVLARLTSVVLLVVGAIFTVLTLSTTGAHPSGIRFLATDLPWVGPLSLVAGALAVPGVAIGRRRRALGGTLLALSLGCALFNLGGVALSPGGSDGGYVSLFLAASSIALLVALILTVTVRGTALFLGGLTGAFLVVTGAAITIDTAFTKSTHTALWVGPLILAAGAPAVPGIIVGRRRRALGSALLVLSIGCILLLLVALLPGGVYYIYLIFFFALLIIPLALALLATAIPQRPPPTTR